MANNDANAVQDPDFVPFISALQIDNFRSIESKSFNFQDRVTVLFGRNGTGKSSIIDAIAAILHGVLVSGVFTDTGGDWLQPPTDNRRVPNRAGDVVVYDPPSAFRVTVTGRFGIANPGTNVQYTFTHTSQEAMSSPHFAVFGQRLREAVSAQRNDTLPLLAAFKGNRQFTKTSGTDYSSAPIKRADGYINCLGSIRSAEILSSWFKRQLLKQGRSGEMSSEKNTVLRALISSVPRLERVDYDPDLADLVVDFGSGDIPFGSLSDGQRSFFGIVAELAIRCTQLNPHLKEEAVRETPGLVLIDEVDLHLHPAWQREVVRSLISCFPNVQFVLTTHSPIVLTEVPNSAIVDLGEAPGELDGLSSFGMDSGWVTRHVMHASTRPDWAKEELEAIEKAVDDGDEAGALRKIADLRSHLGPLDPELVGWEAFLGGVDK